MAFCNTSQFIAKRLIKGKNISNCDQVEKIFKSSAYLAWDNFDLFSDHDITDSGSFPPISRIRKRRSAVRNSKPNKINEPTIVDSDYNCNNINMDNTLVPTMVGGDNATVDQQTVMSSRRNSDNIGCSDNSDGTNNVANVENLFPSPGVIIKDIYEIFQANKPTRLRDAAVINYIKLLFQKKKNNNKFIHI